MFSGSVPILPPFSDLVKERIAGVSDFPYNDYSLFMTMTTLFYKRWPDFKFYSKVYTNEVDYDDVISSSPKKDLCIYWFTCRSDLKEVLKTEHEDLSKHDEFLSSKLGQHIYIKKFGENIASIFFERFDIRLYHCAQMFIPLCFMHLFEENKLTEKEKTFLSSLHKTTDTGYKTGLQSFLEDENLKRYLLKNSLIGLEKTLRGKKYDEAFAKYNEMLAQMDEAMSRYRDACARKNEYEIVACGLKRSLDEVTEDTEFEEYLCSNKLLSDISVKDSKISFVVKTFVNPYLPDDWDALSEKGAIFKNHPRVGNCLDKEADLKLLLDAIFSRNHCLKLRVCGFISLDYYGTYVNSVTGYDFVGKNPSMKNYVPNAHLHKHNCFGMNKDDILTQMRDGDMIGAVECCINVVKRINVAEGLSFDPFVDYIKGCTGKCIVTEDGTEMTCEEAVKYLKEKNNEKASDGNGETDAA